VDVLLFQHGAESPGVAYPADFERVIHDAGGEPRMIAFRPEKSPRDIGAMGRYNSVLAREPSANLAFRPLEVGTVLDKLRSIPGERFRPIL
jgi:hypothetical protein